MFQVDTVQETLLVSFVFIYDLSPVLIAKVIIPTYVHTALNAFADWTLGILPIFIIKDLDMNPRTKVTIAVILALGGM